MLVEVALWFVAVAALIIGPLLLMLSGVEPRFGRPRSSLGELGAADPDEIKFIVAGWLILIIGAICLKLT